MMKVNALFIGLVCCLALQANAQNEFAPIGAEWYYMEIKRPYPNTFKYNNVQYVSEKDTIVQGKTCRLIRGSYYRNGEPFYHEVIYEKNGIVYYYFNEQFRKIFDFTVQERDTVAFEFKSNKKHSFDLDTSIIVLCIVNGISINTIDDVKIKTFNKTIKFIKD